jgi:hypothetical protein
LALDSLEPFHYRCLGSGAHDRYIPLPGTRFKPEERWTIPRILAALLPRPSTQSAG